MTELELNETVAEFMGCEYISYSGFEILGTRFKINTGYTDSLDAIAPVVEKIARLPADSGNKRLINLNVTITGIWFPKILKFNSETMRFDDITYEYDFGFDGDIFFKSPSLALTTACVEVIKGMK